MRTEFGRLALTMKRSIRLQESWASFYESSPEMQRAIPTFTTDLAGFAGATEMCEKFVDVSARSVEHNDEMCVQRGDFAVGVRRGRPTR